MKTLVAIAALACALLIPAGVGAALACALLIPAGVGAAIVPQKSIGGVTLGMSRTAVKAKLGAPVKITQGSNEIGSYVNYLYPTLTVTFFGGPAVTSITTRSAKELTGKGIGVGSTRAQVAAKVAGVQCVTESGYPHCYAGSWLPGKTITDFSLSNGRVNRVTVGYVID